MKIQILHRGDFILESIIKKLDENFSDFSIFNEKITQGYDEKSLIIFENKASFKKHMNNRCFITKSYEIAYFSDDNLTQMADLICEVLRQVDGVYAVDLSYEIDDEKLLVSATYEFFGKIVEESNQNMQKYNYMINI